jgi:hypothetical protein
VIRKDGCDFCTACGAVGDCGKLKKCQQVQADIDRLNPAVREYRR